MQCDFTGQTIPANGVVTFSDLSLEINDFMDDHVKLYTTSYEDLQWQYKVSQVVYADGVPGYPATVPDVTVTDVLFTPPEGFTQAEDGSMVYTAEDGSNIQVQYQDVDTAGLSTATDTQQLAADMEAELECQFSEMVGEDVDVTISECSLVAVDGMPGIRVATSYDLAGVPVSQLSYTISADGIYTFTFTQMGDAGWMDAFEASAQTIDFVTE